MSTNDAFEDPAPEAVQMGVPSSRFGEISANVITADGSFRRAFGGLEDSEMRQGGESVAQNTDIAGRDRSQEGLGSMIAPEGGDGGQEWTTAQSRAIGSAFGKNDFAEVKAFLAQHQALHMSDGPILLRTKDGKEITFFANGALQLDGEMIHEGKAIKDPSAVADLDLDEDMLDAEPDWFSASRQEVTFSDDQVRMLAALGGRPIDNIDDADRIFVSKVASEVHAHRLSEDGAVLIDLEPDAEPGRPSDLTIPRSVAIAADGTLSYGSDRIESSNVSVTDMQRGHHSAEIGKMREHLASMSPQIGQGVEMDGAADGARDPVIAYSGADRDVLDDAPTARYIGVIDTSEMDNTTDIPGPLMCASDGFRDMSTGEQYPLDDPECNMLLKQHMARLSPQEIEDQIDLLNEGMDGVRRDGVDDPGYSISRAGT